MSWGNNHIRFLTAVVAASAILTGCDEIGETPVADTSLTDVPYSSSAYGVENVITAKGVRTGNLTADTALTYDANTDSMRTELIGVNAVFRYQDGRMRARLVADFATTYDRSEALVARSNVEVELADGKRIRSQELHYDPDRNRIWSDSASTIVHEDGSETRGTCFDSDLEFADYEVCSIRGSAGIAPEPTPPSTDTLERGGG